MGIPLSRNSASFPNTLTKPLGTTVLYSNQKSNKSPNKKSASASLLMVSNQETNFCSLGKLFVELEHQNVGLRQNISFLK